MYWSQVERWLSDWLINPVRQNSRSDFYRLQIQVQSLILVMNDSLKSAGAENQFIDFECFTSQSMTVSMLVEFLHEII